MPPSPSLRPKFPILRSSLGSSTRRQTSKLTLFFFTVEFRKFVEKAERQLFALFRAIDKDGNGKLDKLELQTAFKNAGLTLSNRRLAEFFNDMDLNNDGYVSFDEWRLVTPFSIFSVSFFLFFLLDKNSALVVSTASSARLIHPFPSDDAHGY
jgi:hypothetical protein